MPGSVDRKAARELMDIPEVEEHIRAEMPDLIEALLDLARGIRVKCVKIDPITKEKHEWCYLQKPDINALKFLVENVLGKVPQRVEMTGKDGEPMQIVPWMPRGAAIAEGLAEPFEGEVKYLAEEHGIDVEEE